MTRDELTEKAARIAGLIDWRPTCLPGQEKTTIVRQVLESAAANDLPKAAGNCVGRLCAYERALTEEYPDGIEEGSDTLPEPTQAAQRVSDFLRSYGDGRVCVAITPLALYQIPPLYGRDLQALAELAAAPAHEDERVRKLGPGEVYALSVARSAVLNAARKFVRAADMYRRRDLVRSVQQMADEERACVRVASFLSDQIDHARAEREVQR